MTERETRERLSRGISERPALVKAAPDGKRRISIAELFTYERPDGQRVTLCADELEAAGVA